MITTVDEEILIMQEITSRILHELRFGVHRLGYKQLLLLIPCYALDSSQSLSKELYPYAAHHFGYISWHPVEHTIRDAISNAWERRDPMVWDKLFPGLKRPPSNKQFIATIAEQLKKYPSHLREGLKECQEDA